MTRDQAQAAGLPDYDYWLFDSRKLVRMHFDDDDHFLGGELIEDPAEIVQAQLLARCCLASSAVRRDDFATKQAVGRSNVHEARYALGHRLRELRTAAGLSGRQLAESLSWPASKVSKLENGRQTPTDDDIRAGPAPPAARPRPKHCSPRCTPSKSSTPSGNASSSAGCAPTRTSSPTWTRKRRLFRAFESTVIPGLLQTAEYARARFAQGITVFKRDQRHRRGGTGADAAAGDPVPAGQAVPLRAHRSGLAVPALPARDHARTARPADIALGTAQRRARHHRVRDDVRPRRPGTASGCTTQIA